MGVYRKSRQNKNRPKFPLHITQYQHSLNSLLASNDNNLILFHFISQVQIFLIDYYLTNDPLYY
jgi:hypothetical protein